MFTQNLFFDPIRDPLSSYHVSGEGYPYRYRYNTGLEKADHRHHNPKDIYRRGLGNRRKEEIYPEGMNRVSGEENPYRYRYNTELEEADHHHHNSKDIYRRGLGNRRKEKKIYPEGMNRRRQLPNFPDKMEGSRRSKFEQPEISLSDRRRAKNKNQMLHREINEANRTKCEQNTPLSHRFRSNPNILRESSSHYSSSSNKKNDRYVPSLHSSYIFKDPSTVKGVNSIDMDANKNSTSKSRNPLKNRGMTTDLPSPPLVEVEDASDSECEEEFNGYLHNRRPRAGEWIEPVKGIEYM